jgi:signal transduction histidine kinase
MFRIKFPSDGAPGIFIAIPLFLWIVTLSLLLLILFRFVRSGSEGSRPLLRAFVSFVVLAVVYAVTVIFRVPLVFYKTHLFSPYIFSMGKIIPSLGNLLILSIFISFSSWLFTGSFKTGLDPRGGKIFKGLWTGVLLLPVVLIFISVNTLFVKLISGTAINFEPFKVLDLSLGSFAGALSVLLFFLVALILLRKLFSSFVTSFPELLMGIFVSLTMFVPGTVSGDGPDFLLAGFYILTVISHWYMAKFRPGRFNFTVALSFVAALYALFTILTLSEVRNTENKKVLAVSFSSENDPEAEDKLMDLWPQLSSDTTLKSMLSREVTDQEIVEKVYSYLQNRYFGGYLGNYNLNVVTCRNDWTLWIDSEERMADNCFSFFRERIEEEGHLITGTGFWFLDNRGGRPYYLGRLFYPLPGGNTNGLFIELYSDVDAIQAGYSELLLDRKYNSNMRLRDYSYAKYINGTLVLQDGSFPYEKNDGAYIDPSADYKVFNHEWFKHILYKNGNVTVIISEPRLSLTEGIISFAYLFAFILIVANILVIISGTPNLKALFYLNFRQKLQLSFIGILLFSFITVAVIVAVFTIKQYQTSHLDNIKEKVKSIYTELEGKISEEPELSTSWRNENYASLNELLVKLSNVFNTDINLFDKNGYLMATSRPEIFNRDLTGKRLNMEAFINLKELTRSEYIHKEKVASLEFVSAYVPFYNSNNTLLAYLNLPYFRMQSVLAREISNVIVAVINFTLLLVVFATGLAVIISGTLTSPLRMLSEGLSSVELGKRSKHLAYSGHDEISDLVRKYNTMVDELQQSAEQLANSERESAWRDMAKQVAHEIKNPLTPMKLNVQQLFKSWNDGIPGFEKKLERFTKNQIEYIDTLSSIASAFSSFAKLPAASPVELDLLEQIRTTLELFKNTANLSFRVTWPHETKIVIHADREHINGIFSNLIKNAIQAIPPEREGIIRISTRLEGNRVTVSVADNGTGIPENLRKNLFTPNFTTKSSGMGLGLSIVRRYAETAGGRVWFESEQGMGSSFFVELPVIFSVER